jgi:hypothetical protein
LRLERHRTKWLTVEREPVGVGDEELASGSELDDGAAERTAEPAQRFVAPLGRLPFE